MTIPSAGHDVRYSHLEIDTGDGIISGFALCYFTMLEAKKGFQKFHDYINSSSDQHRKLDIRFVQEYLTGFTLEIEIEINDLIYKTVINHVEESYVEKLLTSLKDFPYYFITAGYLNVSGDVVLLPISKYNFFRSEIEVNNKTYFGAKQKKWPYKLFETDHQETKQDHS